MRPILESSSRITDITRTVLYASLVFQDLLRLGGEKAEFYTRSLTTSVALHIDTGHLIPMSNRPRSWRVKRKTKGKGEKMSLENGPDSSSLDSGLPLLDGHDLSMFCWKLIECSVCVLLSTSTLS